jgi:hypothetical protein
MASIRIALQNEIIHGIENRESQLSLLRHTAKQKLEAIAPGRDDDVLVLCRLLFEILAVEDNLGRERFLLSHFRS